MCHCGKMKVLHESIKCSSALMLVISPGLFLQGSDPHTAGFESFNLERTWFAHKTHTWGTYINWIRGCKWVLLSHKQGNNKNTNKTSEKWVESLNHSSSTADSLYYYLHRKSPPHARQQHKIFRNSQDLLSPCESEGHLVYFCTRHMYVWTRACYRTFV